MDLKDARSPFIPSGMSAHTDRTHATSCMRVALLSECVDLKGAMRRMLPAPRYVLTRVCSAELMERAIDKRSCDIAIVDIERQDAWPDTVFSRFDEAAVHFPVIILCKRRHEISKYFLKAQHATNIVSYETISNPRFLNLIEAAVFSTEIASNIGIGDNLDWTPPPAA